ncbi:Gfo/Idh/MocA family oxidoreductase [Devosia sp. PTR5]|uniref:Gfo/Idh/MocA family oxidoreductase n=1 Tax=Devosia oryzisoli TaxID=2774138 RepID=A0A927ITQ8_9HYPH|nr:Gfo/Idh/MocA family oxidoreductase [Devosia oryzisoli]MBD8066799.1 Gfo/Idh/MocA family oxidoreductase [Devosia oryzisoli]
MKRVALIGLGKMGLSHLALFNAHPDVEVVAVCDPAKFLLAPLAQYTGLATYSDHTELFEKETLDAVVIATPSRYHADLVRQAFERNIHVFCEKPFSLAAEEGQELVALGQSRGLVGQVGYHYRYVGAFQAAKRLLESGVIGRAHNIRSEAYGPVVLRPKGGTWRSSKNEGGGCLYDYASHALDLMNYLVGQPVGVKGTVLNKVFSRDVDDEVYSTLTYANGMVGHVLANWSDESQRKMSMKISIWGEGGKIVADRQEVQVFIRDADVAREHGLKPGWNVLYTTELTEEVWFYLRGEEYSAQVDAFIAAVGGDPARNLSPMSSAVQTDALIEKLIRDAEGLSQATIPARPAKEQRGLIGALFGTRS